MLADKFDFKYYSWNFLYE